MAARQKKEEEKEKKTKIRGQHGGKSAASESPKKKLKYGKETGLAGYYTGWHPERVEGT